MSGPLPWRSERPLDAALVVRVVEARFPALRPARAEFLDEGWDSEVYLVNGEWIVRFPKRADVVPHQAVERALLPRLAPRLPVAIPAPELLGEPGADFPFRFLGYRRVEGVPAWRIDPASVDVETCGREFGAFLSHLHAFPAAQAKEAGVPTLPPLDAGSTRDKYRSRWTEVAAAVPDALARRVRVLFDAPPRPTPTVELCFVHADLTYDHVLLRPDGSGLVGIIDWADACVADPVWDLGAPWAWFGEPFVRAALTRYDRPVAEATLDRAREVGAYCSLSALWWGVRATRPRDVSAALRGLDLTLPPA